MRCDIIMQYVTFQQFKFSFPNELGLCPLGFGWMVVRFVRVIRVPACARVSRVSRVSEITHRHTFRVCPGSPGVFLPVLKPRLEGSNFHFFGSNFH